MRGRGSSAVLAAIAAAVMFTALSEAPAQAARGHGAGYQTAPWVIGAMAGGGGSFPGDGGPATSAMLSLPAAATVDAAGNVIIDDWADNNIRVVAKSTGHFYGQDMVTGDIYTVAGSSNGVGAYRGDFGPATSAFLYLPEDVAVDAAGNLLIADTGNNVIRVVAENPNGPYYGVPTSSWAVGDIYTIAGGGNNYQGGDGGPAIAAELSSPSGVAVDAAGNLLIADTGDNRVRVVAAGSSDPYEGPNPPPWTPGYIYTVAGGGSNGLGDGGAAKAAELSSPSGVAVDAAGNLLIADTGDNRVRVVAVGSSDPYDGPNPPPWTPGDIYTVAGDGLAAFSGDGGPAISAELSFPEKVAVDAQGNLLIADTNNYRIRVVAPATGTLYGQTISAGDIATVAGGGSANPGNGGPATSASLDLPRGAAPGTNGTLLVADTGRNQIQVVGPPVRSTNWNVGPGGQATARAMGPQFKDSATGTVIGCKTSQQTATWKAGTGMPGLHIVHITADTFSGCAMGGAAISVTAHTSPSGLYFDALSYKPGKTTGKITGIQATVTGTACSAAVAGTSATAPGTLKATYTNSTGKLTALTTQGTLHVWNVKGCLGLISNGDPITLAAAYTVSPKQTMTSP